MTPLLESVLDASMDAVITVDAAGRILRWNKAAEQMFGFVAEDVVGRELAQTIVPEQLRAAHRAGLSAFAHGGAARIGGGRTETTGQRADGTQFPIELTITRVEDGADVFFVGYLRDITERTTMVAALRDSRARLITSSDDARRRVERDLHDGAQQQLVALAIALGRARRQIDVDRTSAARLIDSSMTMLTGAIDELRELARGVHNEILTGRGLAAAINHLARRSPIDVVANIDLPERLPATTETSVYYLLAEALTNATKYGAGAVRIDVAQDGDGALVGTVSDDGPGGADPSKGTGLVGMSDRLRALGGCVELSSPPGAGTTLRFAVPLERVPVLV